MSEHEHDGHRQRLLSKIETNSLEWHEYLEGLLFFALPRVNTNGIAHRLLSEFGSIEGVFSATKQQLQSVKGVGENTASFLHLFYKFVQYFDRVGNESAYPKTYDATEFKKTVPELYKKEEKEVFDCYLLDESSNVVVRKRFTSERKTFVHIDPRDLLRLFSDVRPYGAVFVHNHLDYNCFPSAEDDKTTHQLQMMCSLENVRMLDHLICAKSGVYSYYDNNRMQKISRLYSVGSFLAKMDECEEDLSQEE